MWWLEFQQPSWPMRTRATLEVVSEKLKGTWRRPPSQKNHILWTCVYKQHSPWLSRFFGVFWLLPAQPSSVNPWDRLPSLWTHNPALPSISTGSADFFCRNRTPWTFYSTVIWVIPKKGLYSTFWPRILEKRVEIPSLIGGGRGK